MTTASIAGCTGTKEQVRIQPVSAYGYGGAPVIQQSSSTLSVSETEPNDREENALVVSTGATISGELVPSDSDWYAVDLSSDEDVTVEFDRALDNGVTAIILYDPAGQFGNLRYVTTGDPTAFSHTTKMAGTHYVQVVDTHDSAGEYSLVIANDTTETDTATATPTETDTATTTPIETPTAIQDDYGEQGYGEYGYGGVVV